MVVAFSETYGPPSRRVLPSRAIVERAGQEADLLVASWEDAEYLVTLLRMPDSSAFRLIVASTRLRALAEAAGAAGVLLDLHEAPRCTQRRRRGRPLRSREVEAGQQGCLQAVTVHFISIRSPRT